MLFLSNQNADNLLLFFFSKTYFMRITKLYIYTVKKGFSHYQIIFMWNILIVDLSRNIFVWFWLVGEDSSVDTAVMCTRAVVFDHDNFPLDVTGTYIELEFTTNSVDNFYGFMLSFTEVFSK